MGNEIFLLAITIFDGSSHYFVFVSEQDALIAYDSITPGLKRGEIKALFKGSPSSGRIMTQLKCEVKS